jgi:hypothetical protein
LHRSLRCSEAYCVGPKVLTDSLLRIPLPSLAFTLINFCYFCLQPSSSHLLLLFHQSPPPVRVIILASRELATISQPNLDSYVSTSAPARITGSYTLASRVHLEPGGNDAKVKQKQRTHFAQCLTISPYTGRGVVGYADTWGNL